jgi:hypothetical protein
MNGNVLEKNTLIKGGNKNMKERIITLLYNAIILLEESYSKEEILEELGMSELEYTAVMDEYQETICGTFG